MQELGSLTSLLIFCEKCDRVAEPRHIRKSDGKCRICRHDTWRMLTTFTNKGVTNALNVVGLATLATVGVGVQFKGGKETSVELTGVQRREIKIMCKKMGGSEADIKNYIDYRTKKEDKRKAQEYKETLEENGYNCKECGILFVPDPAKPWNTDAYCSRMCWSVDFPEKEEEFAEQLLAKKKEEEQTGKSRIGDLQVSCKNGHTFEVKSIFIGTHRKCPECGEKTLIEKPDGPTIDQIEVVCPNSHKFLVNKMFLGGRKPCPECGISTKVEPFEEKQDLQPFNSDNVICEAAGKIIPLLTPNLHFCCFFITCDGESLDYNLVNENGEIVISEFSEEVGLLTQQLYMGMAENNQQWNEAKIYMQLQDGEWLINKEFSA